MPLIPNEFKAKLGEALAKFYRHFGKVSPRRDYKDDESGGGAGLRLETHPLLAEQPTGAASDLTFVAADHADITELAQERANECSAELQMQPALQAVLQPGMAHMATMTPAVPTGR